MGGGEVLFLALHAGPRVRSVVATGWAMYDLKSSALSASALFLLPEILLYLPLPGHLCAHHWCGSLSTSSCCASFPAVTSATASSPSAPAAPSPEALPCQEGWTPKLKSQIFPGPANGVCSAHHSALMSSALWVPATLSLDKHLATAGSLHLLFPHCVCVCIFLPLDCPLTGPLAFPAHHATWPHSYSLAPGASFSALRMVTLFVSCSPLCSPLRPGSTSVLSCPQVPPVPGIRSACPLGQR